MDKSRKEKTPVDTFRAIDCSVVGLLLFNLRIRGVLMVILIPDGALKEESRVEIRHHRNLYLNHQDPIVFLPLSRSGVSQTVITDQWQAKPKISKISERMTVVRPKNRI